MIRTAADVQAEIDALEQASHERHLAAMVEIRAIPQEQRVVAGLLLDNHTDRLSDEDDAVTTLRAERDHLARTELDAATPPGVRTTALRLRAAHRSVDGWAMGAEDSWEALDTSEAAAWAAVAREAGR